MIFTFGVKTFQKISFFTVCFISSLCDGLLSFSPHFSQTQKLSSEFYGEPLPEAEQEVKLTKALDIVGKEAYLMKTNLDKGELPDALQHCSKMLNELRTSTLSPKRYYNLYMAAFDELKYLEWWLYEERNKRGKKLSELYETVQYASSVLPRLYLLITVGSAYIRSGEAEAKDVLRDLVEMCRGVQHPTRGLFLRNFLSEMMKSILPDVDENSVKGDVRDSIDFILTNFTEMNKLWVRLQQGPAHEKAKREADREALKLLVGKNLSRLSQLEGVDCNLYSSTVMNKIFTQIVKCNDKMAQQYLMEIVIQIFPDEYHLATLSNLLSAFSKLDPNLDVRPIIVSLIDRLNAFAQKDKSAVPADMDIYKVFESAIVEICTERTISVNDYLIIHAALLKLSMTMYGNKYVDDICKSCADRINSEEDEVTSEKITKEILDLLSIPLEEGHMSPIEALAMPNYTNLSSHLAYQKLKTIQSQILKSLLSQKVNIKTSEELNRILSFITTLLSDEKGPFEGDDEDFMIEQNLVCSMVHSICSSETKTQIELLKICLETFKKGGDARLCYTIPALVFACIKLSYTISKKVEDSDEKKEQLNSLFKLIKDCIAAIAENDKSTEMNLRLYIQAAVAASNCEMPELAYDLFVSAINVFEEKIADSQQRYNALVMLISSARQLYINSDDYTTLISTIVKHCNHVLKKSDQSKLISMASHMFWREGEGSKAYLEGLRVLECLQRALKVSEQVTDVSVNVGIRIELLNRYLYFFDHNNNVNSKYISGMVDLITTSFTKGTEDSDALQTYFRNTLAYIQAKKKDPESEERYKEIN